MVVDALARKRGIDDWRTKDSALQAFDRGRELLLVKPQTFMNDSGTPLRRIAGWHKITPQAVLVVSDDLDLPFGRLRMRASGGHGGHNGLRSIVEVFGEDFPRLRIGIGRGGEAIDHVLAPFDEEEFAALDRVVDAAVAGIEQWLAAGPVAAMQLLNGWRLDGEGQTGVNADNVE